MRGAPLALVAAVAVTGCSGPRTKHVVGAPSANDIAPGDIFFDCDAAAGNLSQWSRAIEPSGSATGSLFVTEARYHPDWRPFARVAVTGSLPNQRAGIEVMLGKGATTLLAYVRGPDGAKRVELSQAPTSGVRFELRWTGQSLQARTAPTTPWLDVPLPFLPRRLALECSTANAVFHDVTITTAPPQA